MTITRVDGGKLAQNTQKCPSQGSLCKISRLVCFIPALNCLPELVMHLKSKLERKVFGFVWIRLFTPKNIYFDPDLKPSMLITL